MGLIDEQTTRRMEKQAAVRGWISLTFSRGWRRD